MTNKFKNTWGRIKGINDYKRECKAFGKQEEYKPGSSEQPKGVWHTIPDTRYNTPKEKHKASDEQIDQTINETEIYRKAKERILKHQQGQVGYGIDKYPEPLNADTWTIFETLDHAMDESIDRMHYFEMLRDKFEEMVKEINFLKGWKSGAEKELKELREYKASIEKLYGGPISIYRDEHLYADNIAVYGFSGADQDGDSYQCRNLTPPVAQPIDVSEIAKELLKAMDKQALTRGMGDDFK